MKRTLVLYESKYGFTKMLAEHISLILGPAKCLRLSELDDPQEDYGFIVICAPVYSEKIDDCAVDSIVKNADWLKHKKVIVLCTCLAVNYKVQYLKPLLEILEDNIAFSATIAGELIMEKLSESDYKLIKELSDNTTFECKDYKLFDKEKFINLILYIKDMKDQPDRVMEERRLIQICQDFMKKHNTCTLATGYDSRVRATPIEYIFLDGFIYMLSDGGEKFVNILYNPNVSICIFNQYRNMNQLSNMQITGTAELISPDSEEYKSVLVLKRLNYEKVRMLPFSLNLLKVDIGKIELHWSDFKEMGYDAQQILYNNE